MRAREEGDGVCLGRQGSETGGYEGLGWQGE